MAAGEACFTVGVIADCQYADHDDEGARLYRQSPAKLAAAVDHFNRLDLAYVLHLGDFIDRYWDSYDTVLPIAERLRHPWRFVLGNHDFAIPDEQKARLPSRLGMPARYYSFEHGDWLFLIVDGNDLSLYGWAPGKPELALSQDVRSRLYASAPDWNGGIGEAQLRWIDQTLADAETRGMKAVLYCHFPLYPDNIHNLWNAAEVSAVVEQRPAAKAWINGHNHDGGYARKNGLHYLTLKGMLDTEETAYATLAFHPDRIDVAGYGRQPSLSLPLR
jgi:calcineurin-like phosphoesterase family protein